MSKLTLDEAIEYYINVATQRAVADEGMGVNDKWYETKFMTKKGSEQVIADNRQLAEWLTELKELRSLKTDYVFFKAEAKKLLRTAVEDFSFVSEKFINSMDSSCSMFNHIAGCVKDCPMSSFDDYGRCKWRYTDEALKLIGDDNNGT